MGTAWSHSSSGDRPARRIDYDPAKAAEARARTRRVLERMDRMDRIVVGKPLRRSLRPITFALRAPATVPGRTVRPRGTRRNRRVRTLANRRAAASCRGRDPDLPDESAAARANSAGSVRGASPDAAIGARTASERPRQTDAGGTLRRPVSRRPVRAEGLHGHRRKSSGAGTRRHTTSPVGRKGLDLPRPTRETRAVGLTPRGSVGSIA